MTVTKIGRIAMREEGANWNAYYALTDTMADAIFLGSIARRFIVDNADRRAAFLDLMKQGVADIIFERTGQRVTWPDGVQPAPEHERAGNA